MTGPGWDEMGQESRTSPAEPADGPGEMRMVNELDRSLDDAVLSGDVDRVPADLGALAAVIAALRARAAAQPVPPMGPALRAQLHTPNVVTLRAARSARRSLALAAAVLAVVALVGVGAARNQLPGGLQDVVASTAEKLGIDVPRSSERGDARSDEGLEHGRDDTAPNAPVLVGAPGHDGATPGGATPALPGGPEGPALPATPPEPVPQPEKAEKAEKLEKLEKPEQGAPETSAPASREEPDPPPAQGGVAPSQSQGSDSAGGEPASPPSPPRDGSSAAEPSASTAGGQTE